MQRQALLTYCNDLLRVADFQDYAPNGLQVEGGAEVKKIVTGVTACQALIDAAIELSADTVLVHHGYFWKNEPPSIVGMKQQRIKKLLAHNLNLIAYHLPLDSHPQLGNNAQLGQLWGLEDMTPEPGILRLGKLASPVSVSQFIDLVGQSLGRAPLHLPGGPSQIQTIAWCSGGAQNYLQQAAQWGAHLYLSGEVSEQNLHEAAELGVHYLAAGHHATERLGVKALGEHLQQAFDIEVVFVDIDNPI